MLFTLIFIGAVGSQHYLGDFNSEKACQIAIRAIFLQKLAPNAAENPAAVAGVDIAIRYQREYVCVPKG